MTTNTVNSTVEVDNESLEKLRGILSRNYGLELEGEELKSMGKSLVGYAFTLYNIYQDNQEEIEPLLS